MLPPVFARLPASHHEHSMVREGRKKKKKGRQNILCWNSLQVYSDIFPLSIPALQKKLNKKRDRA